MSKKLPVRIENGIIVGTASDKYQSRNPIARHLIRGFDRAVGDLAAQVDPSRILEVGCGEGHITSLLLERTRATITATDISESVLNEARLEIADLRVTFSQLSIYSLAEQAEPAPLVVSCEVLEHLDDPELALAQLGRVAAPYCLMSVPREPIWRILNMARGAYWSELGNTPGHLQHWSQESFLNFVAQRFEIVALRAPLPWTVVLGRSRRTCDE